MDDKCDHAFSQDLQGGQVIDIFGHNDDEGGAMSIWAPLEPIVVLLRKDHAFHGVDYTGQSVI